MAKVGFWLNGSQGKLAGATMYKDKNSGETIIREVVTPSNPKTDKQNIQRIIMNTVMNAYSLLKEICDHSFEGQKAGRDTMGYFMKQNIQIAREAIARMQSEGVDFYDMYNFTPVGMREFVCNQYQIAMGSLPQVAASIVADERVYGALSDVTENTYQAIIDAYGLQRGDQLTFMMVVFNGTQKEFKFARIILDPTDPDTHLPLTLDTPFVVAGKVNAPSIRNEGEISFDNDFSNGLWFRYRNSAMAGCACIVSRQSGDQWLRSTTYLSYKDNTDYSLGECMDRIATGATTLYAPNEYYLNNAGEGGGVAAATGEGSGAGSGGGTAPAVTVNSVTVAGQAAVSGTLKTIEATVPFGQKSVVTTLSGAAPAGSSVKIIKQSDSSVASTVEPNEQGVATNSFEPTADAIYKVVVNFGAGDVETGYTFKFTETEDEPLPGGE